MRTGKEALKAGLLGGLGGLVFSMIINYFVIPMPETTFTNALGNGASGLISGFMGGYLAISKLRKNESSTS